jgi:hypothetical protein
MVNEEPAKDQRDISHPVFCGIAQKMSWYSLSASLDVRDTDWRLVDVKLIDHSSQLRDWTSAQDRKLVGG